MEQNNNLGNKIQYNDNIQKIVNINNLIHNCMIFKEKCKNAKLCAVVKANAYGIGDEIVVNAIKSYVDFFAVANKTEALKVRNFTNKPILILGEINKNEIEECIKNHISISISDDRKLKQISNISNRLNIKAIIHFKINTGMNRLGFKDINDFKKVYNNYFYDKNIVYEGIFSHIYDADDSVSTYNQKARFDSFISSVNCKNLIKHLASTKVTLDYYDLNYDMCRIGIGLYNYSQNNKYDIRPVLQVKTKIIKIINIKKGESVGYGKGFINDKNRKIAVLPIGYADGYNRLLSNNAQVLVNNQYVSLIGNVCMDMCFIDITNIKCKINDEVVILGKNGDKEINALELASSIDTIDYEILTNFNNLRASLIITNDN